MARRRRRRSSKIFGMSPMTLALVGAGAFAGYHLLAPKAVAPVAGAPAADNVATSLVKAAGSITSLFH